MWDLLRSAWDLWYARYTVARELFVLYIPIATVYSPLAFIGMYSISYLRRHDLESLQGIRTKVVTWRAMVILFYNCILSDSFS